MAYSETPSVSTGDLWTAANQNTYLRDNLIDHETRILAAESSITTLQGSGLFLIDEQVLDSAAKTVTFSSIPQTYTHLKIIYDARSTLSDTSDPVRGKINNDSTSGHYAYQYTSRSSNVTTGDDVYGSIDSFFVGQIVAASGLSNASGQGEILITNYKGTSFLKSLISTYGLIKANADAGMGIGQTFSSWMVADAINRVDLWPFSGDFVAGSSFWLYGVK
jgi:hypothetical protein